MNMHPYSQIKSYFNFLKIFSYNTFYQVFSSLTLLQFCSALLHTQFYDLSLSQKKKIQNKTKINKLTNKTSNKNCSKQHIKSPREYILYWLTTYSWPWDLLWSVLDVPSDSPLEKTFSLS